MPDPRTLKVDDLIRFVSLPDEWDQPGYTVHRDSIRFMKAMIARSWPSRISEIDEAGYPWIDARIRWRGRWAYHRWNIMEHSGWRRVKRRS